jgi:hypothetical protein
MEELLCVGAVLKSQHRVDKMCGSRKCARKSQRGVGFPWNPLPVATIFENLEDGLSIEEIMEQFDVTREQVTAALDFAARSLEAPTRR